MVEVCDECKKGEIRSPDEVSFAFYRCHMGDGKLSPTVRREIKLCSVECFEKWFKEFKNEYMKQKSYYDHWRR